MRIRLIHRILAALLAQLILFDIGCPTMVYALTGGPSQPEFASFEPIGTDQMVDLFTGDFNYNLPLLTVPGPNGGYPVNLSYHAGIGAEEEASWVGLGWNVNVGAINRMLRGLPDDFQGDPVTTTQQMRPNRTYSFTFGAGFKTEFLGFDFDASRVNGSLYYNTYKGVGLRTGVKLRDANQETFHAQLDLSMDSRAGFEMTPAVSLQGNAHDLFSRLTLAPTFHSTYGLHSFDLALSYRPRRTSMKAKDGTSARKVTDPGRERTFSGIDFSAPSYVPTTQVKTTGLNLSLGLAWGPASNFTNSEIMDVSGLYSTNQIPRSDRTRTAPAYGYLYSEHRTDEHGLMDFNRDKDHPVTRRSPNIPMPVFTYDPFMVTGQGTGGAFRPYRSDIGVLSDIRVEGHSDGVDGSAELGTPPPGWKIGADVGYVNSTSYTGKWKNGIASISGDSEEEAFETYNPSTNLRFQPKHTDRPLYEPFYFKSAGEMTASSPDEWAHIQGESAVRFELAPLLEMGENFSFNGKARIRNTFQNGIPGIPFDGTRRSSREKRVQNMEYRTHAQIRQDPGYASRPKHLVNSAGVAQAYNNALEECKPHHIGEISVLNADGTRYTYGLPVYNIQQKEVTFATEDRTKEDCSTGIAVNSDHPLCCMSDPGALEDNNAGRDHFYRRTELPQYTHSHLLTAVTSHDYVDLNGDGPTEDDLGYYAKFNYQLDANEAWRSPYRGAHFVEGYYSDQEDDKGNYTYGVKKVYYLASIETKTHIARFTLADRRDARGAFDETNGSGSYGSTAKRLERIDLYSKGNPQPIKSVVFSYSYELCPDTPNHSGSSQPSEPGTGKLTLKKVHFEYMGSAKGALSPYRFDYGDPSDPDSNPPYHVLSMDRWGNHKPFTSGTTHVPYVDQTIEADAVRDHHSAAWCLQGIDLPSGGRIEVDYESDDYAYVQDHDAMQMFRIVGTSKLAGNSTPSETDRAKLDKDYRRIYVDMGRTYSNTSDLDKAIDAALSGIQEIYFKTWQRLKKKPVASFGIDIAHDYVEGYAKIVPGSGDASDMPGLRFAYFDVKEVDYGWPAKAMHPFRMAGWQYLRYERPDLLTPPNNIAGNLGASLTMVLNTVLSASRMLLGFYNMAGVQGWCREIPLGEGTNVKPSFVRLRTPSGTTFTNGEGTLALKGKFGGGHRVRSISVVDNWVEGSNTYGKTYEYTKRTEDGSIISSGVAEYEPLLGGEEIALRKPIWFNGSDARINLRNMDVFKEEPLGEALYPSAKVGYSRVIVRDLLPETEEGLDLTGNGMTVHEFYTAKDFPVRVETTDLEDYHFAPPTIPIPFIGTLQYNNHGYSQGYAVHLNDMHGKLKSVASFSQCVDPDAQPRTRTTHRYNTLPGHPDRLDDKALVLTDHFEQSTAKLGTSTEFYVDLRENSSSSLTASAGGNLQGTPFPFPSLIPVLDGAWENFRTVATTKVVHKHGILAEVITEENGARSISRNLVYDAETGTPLLTTTNNAFDNPIYAYKYAAHMAYPGMGPAYHNWGAEVALGGSGIAGKFTVTGGVPNTIFQPGDELVHTGNGTHYWVDQTDATHVYLLNAANSSAPSAGFTARIQRSGHRNMQGLTNGSLISQRNILEEHDPDMLPYMRWYNANITGSSIAATFDMFCITPDDICLPPPSSPENHVCMDVRGEAGTGEEDLGTITFGIGELTPDLGTANPTAGCSRFTFRIPFDDPNPGSYEFLGLLDIWLLSPDVPDLWIRPYEMRNIHTGEVYVMAIEAYADPTNCGWDCLDILHADATTFSDSWNYDYPDAGGPMVGAAPLTHSSALNPYRYGQSGVWRPSENFLYQVERQRTIESPGGSPVAPGARGNIRVDGDYSSFTLFDFGADEQDADGRWQRKDKMTRYSPYGFSLESIDALDIPSSALYGYANSAMTATAQSAAYHEIGFDGFEDHGLAFSSLPHGHIDLEYTGTPYVLTTDAAHTGKRSLVVPPGSGLSNKPFIERLSSAPTANWTPQAKRYRASAWFKSEVDAVPDIVVGVSALTPLTVPAQVRTISAAPIEGWRKVEVEFSVPSDYTTVTLHFTVDGAAGNSYVDDIRIQPATANMRSFVYDPSLLRLCAELDERNYATFYSYDEEGTLVQVKKETERGVSTIRTTRKHIPPQP